MLINTTTMVRTPEADFRALFNNKSFPATLTDDSLEGLGFKVLNEPEQPSVSAKQRVIDGGNAQIDGKWFVKWVVVDKTREEILAESPRVAQINERLAAIDVATIRPLRALQLGRGTQADTDTLNALQTEYASLLDELDALTA